MQSNNLPIKMVPESIAIALAAQVLTLKAQLAAAQREITTLRAYNAQHIAQRRDRLQRRPDEIREIHQWRTAARWVTVAAAMMIALEVILWLL